MAFDFARRADESLADPLPADPRALLQAWLDEVTRTHPLPNPLAMTLATVDARGHPAARMVICRGLDLDAGWLLFYTDARSPKGRELAALPRAALVLHWNPLERQVRVTGPVSAAPDADADAGFAARPHDARNAVLGSEQSAPTAARDPVVERMRALAARHPERVPRPDHWRGYRVWIETLELWAGQPGRVHDRGLWTRELTPAGDAWRGGPWSVARLRP